MLQLDQGRGSLDVLPEVVKAVGGRAKIIVDGCFQRGTDVVKAIALGADLVGMGRMPCFGLAAAGRTDAKGRPGLLQASLIAREFDDTMRLTSPPRFVQRPLFAALAPLARRRGLRGSYPEYLRHTGEVLHELEPLPPEIERLLS